MNHKANFEQALSKKDYLLQEIPKFLSQKYSHDQRFLSPYNVLRIKRFFIQTLMLYLFQTLTLLFIDPSQPAISINFSLGISFTLFFLLGNSAFLGLFLGCLTAYLLKNYSTPMTLLYLVADVGGGYLGAMLCQKKLSSEIRPFANRFETMQFIKINAFITAPVTSIFQMLGFIFGLMYAENSTWNNIWNNTWDNLSSLAWNAFLDFLYQYIYLCFFNLNGILVISSFLLSWVYIFHSREKISPIPIPAFILAILALYLFIYNHHIIYLLLVSMAISFLWSLFFGYLIATALIFIISLLYMIVLSSQKPFLFEHFDMGLPSIMPFLLFIFIIVMLWLGHVKITKSYEKKRVLPLQ